MMLVANALHFPYLRLPLFRYQQSQDESDIESSYVRMQKLDQYHGQASGIFGCDEHLAGNMPSRGENVLSIHPQLSGQLSKSLLIVIIFDPC